MSISMDEARLRVCQNCGEEYDPGLEICPYCEGEDYEDEFMDLNSEYSEGTSSD